MKTNATAANLPFWTLPHRFGPSDDGARDPLRAQMALDRIADSLFREKASGIGLTSLTDHLGYLAFHGWAQKFVNDRGPAAAGRKAAYDRLVWIHAWVNKSLAIESGNRWVVYGILDLKRHARPTVPPKWSSNPPRLVALDPKARYRGLWDLLGPQVQTAAVKSWPGLKRAQITQLNRWMEGDDRDLPRITPRSWPQLSLKGLRPLSLLSRAVCDARIEGHGVGRGLRSVTLGQMLSAVAEAGHVVRADAWTAGWLKKTGPVKDPVKERLRRAAIGRAIVMAANWSFFKWARAEMKLDPLRDVHLGEKAPSELLQRVWHIVRADTNTLSAFDGIDEDVELSGGTFRFREALKRRTEAELRDYVVDCAGRADKGFVSGAHRFDPTRRDFIEQFSGGYAGGLRLAQVWRFGKDVNEAGR